jgi:hypothetical protein
MPVPLTTTLLALAFLFALIGVDLAAVVLGVGGGLNQIAVAVVAYSEPPR